MDWDDLRFLLAFARHGSASAAAHHLGVTQSTVGRRLASFQDGLGVRLIVRNQDGYQLTDAGSSIVAHSERAATEVEAIQDKLTSFNNAETGYVTIAASPCIINNFLLPVIPHIRRSHRGIVIEIINDMPGEPLATREADIGVRFSDFEHPSLVVRRIAMVPMGFYASKDYIAEHGLPRLADGCSNHGIVAQLENRGHTTQSRWLARHASHATVVCRTNSFEAQYGAVASGGGLALLARFYERVCPALQEVGQDAPVDPAEIWLGTHEGSRSTRRVKIVVHHLAGYIRTRLRMQ